MFDTLRNYSFSLFRKDFFAGCTVAVIALPLAMAFAIASGVAPEKGLYTAIVAGFLISFLGGSRVQIGGPTGAFVVVIYDIMQRTGYAGLCTSLLIASILLIVAGLFRLGSWIKFVPHPLITGFTSGIAVIIFSSQIKDFFGLQMGAPPADFVDKWTAYIQAFPTLNHTIFAVGAATLASILLIRRFLPRLPWGIASIVLATAVCALFQLPVETIASRFGDIPNTLPLPSIPSFSFPKGQLSEILFDALTIAFLGGIESLLSAVIGDGMSDGRHRSNCELIAQGIANLGSLFFGGIPATGAIARTAANVKSGAQTPVAGMIHAMALFLIILVLAPTVSQIPLAALSAVLFMVAWNMSEAPHFLQLLKAPAADLAILLTAFFLTIFVDITIAITFGMILSSFVFMKKMSHHTKTVLNPTSRPGINVYELHGPLFFGSADLLKSIDSKPKVMILHMHRVPLIDASGMHALKQFFSKCKKENTTLLLSGLSPQAKKDLDAFGMSQAIGENHLFPDIENAISHASTKLT